HAEFGSPPMSSFRPLVTALLGRFFSVVALMADGSFMEDILMASVFLDPEIACAPPAVSRASRMPAAPAPPSRSTDARQSDGELSAAYRFGAARWRWSTGPAGACRRWRPPGADFRLCQAPRARRRGKGCASSWSSLCGHLKSSGDSPADPS